MIDFTNCAVNRLKAYGGANGNKINIEYENESYMLKFASKKQRNNPPSYTSSCISEYVGCHIYESIGIAAQKTLLGNYTVKGVDKLVVACQDFECDGHRLIEFAQLKNTCIDSEQNGYGTDLYTIIEAIDEQQLFSSEKLKAFFWEMFIVDAFVGNFDRHNGNWGLLVNDKTQMVEIAPVYDCGSCLYSQMNEEQMQTILNDESEMDKRVFLFPTSAITINNKKLSYFDFISSMINEDCTTALKNVNARIDMQRIHQIINETPGISSIRVEFYKTMLKARKERILDYSLRQAQPPEKKRTEYER